ncbi:hypothetical protein KXD40_002640 [Peronospora effusa]|uniref:RxLR effector protein n=1 Tax=Peronospora effusa TaxID=542832 RepID=A0A3R7Y0X3_9STRA|nr:hypothetical protein DD237_008596 [Peronospora effusa]UIZ26461.1 hypothetical protein KXD40_002640 [Peronospora effusa]CAI5702225.1 unnamed protein product [Peronospora effusa]
MTSMRFTYIIVMVFAAILYASGDAVSAMETFDTALIENTVPTDAGFDSDAQRRLRGAVKEDPTDEERGPSLNADITKMFNNMNYDWTHFTDKMKKVVANKPIDTKQFRKLMKFILMKAKRKGV